MGFFARIARALSNPERPVDHVLPSGAQFSGWTDSDGAYHEVDSSHTHGMAYYSNAFRACLLAKARPLASLPVHVYERRDGVRLEADSGFAKAWSRLLRQRWNPFMTASEGYRWALMTKDTLGNAFMRVRYASDGTPDSIWPMSQRPDVLMGADGKPLFSYGGDKFTKPGTYLCREIIWIKSPVLDKDGMYGVSLAELGAAELGLSIDLDDFYHNLLKDGTHSPGWIETDAKLSPQDFDTLQQRMRGGSGIDKAGTIKVLDSGLKYHSTSMSMVDMNLVEQERWILQQTCRTLSVPPQEVFDLSNATYSNIEQGAMNFANKTLVPECNEVERALSCVLWDAGLDGCYVQFDMNGLLRGSYKERMEGYRIGINAGFYSPNDVRAKEDERPYEGGSVYFRSSAYLPVDPETGEELAPRGQASFPGAQGEGSESPKPQTSDGQALAVIRRDMLARIKGRISESGDTPKTRDFAQRVLAPLADAYEVDGIEYDLQSDIEELFS